jgi:transcriptional regulator with PAS, ATPase and Fis domain
MVSNSGTTSALSIIKKLNEDIPYSVKKGEEFLETLSFLNRELSFAKFAIAKAGVEGDLPKDQYFASKDFPVFDPKTLELALKTSESKVEPLNHVLIVPCLHDGQLVGVLFAHHVRNHWISSESILVEIAATELAHLMLPSVPGLTLSSNLKAKTKISKSVAPIVIGESDKLKQVLNVIDRVAPTTASILILGESGTGKELIAQRIHALSDRRDMPFVALNCGALTESLLESELFGHEKGSFTGANTTKKGLAEIASGGTLFLDEIGEMALSLQAKMLRFLQEGEFFRVGGKDPIHVDVRIVSATNRDLETEIRNSKFREDLYYRLNTITIKSPALRDRKEDLPLLIQHFGSDVLSRMAPDALAALKTYAWPGNIRELQNAIERIRILTAGAKVEILDLPANIRNALQSASSHQMLGAPPVGMPLEDLERIHILRCLEHFEGNKTRAAQSLGITIKTLYNKLHRYGILDKTEANL